MTTYWMIQSTEGYQSTAWQTRVEARTRLAQIADETVVYPEHHVVRQAPDFFQPASGEMFRVVKV